MLIILLIINLNLSAKYKDSSINLIAQSGSYYLNFNNHDFSYFNKNMGGFRYYFTDYDNYCLGLKFNVNITQRKQFSISTLYSKSSIGYLKYSGTNLNEGIIFKQHLKGVIANTLIQYQTFKWLKINYGLSHYFNITNKFDNENIAKELSWYNEQGKNKMKIYSIALNAGIEFKLYKRLSIELNSMRGLNKLITLKILNDLGNYEFPQKIIYTGFTLNYKLK